MPVIFPSSYVTKFWIKQEYLEEYQLNWDLLLWRWCLLKGRVDMSEPEPWRIKHEEQEGWWFFIHHTGLSSFKDRQDLTKVWRYLFYRSLPVEFYGVILMNDKCLKRIVIVRESARFYFVLALNWALRALVLNSI